jgi:hypothetical protein
VVPSNVLSARRPVAPAVAQVDPALRTNLATQPWQRHAPPPAPAKVVAVPGGAVPATPAAPARPAAPNAAATTPGAAPAVIDLRRERAPQRPAMEPQSTTTVTPRPTAPGTVAPAPAPTRSQTAPAAQAAPATQTAPAAQSAAPPRRPDEPGAERDKRGRQWAAPSLPAPVRVEPPRQAAPQPMPQSTPQPAPAARDVQRVPQTDKRGEPDGKARAPESRSNNPRSQMQ